MNEENIRLVIALIIGGLVGLSSKYVPAPNGLLIGYVLGLLMGVFLTIHIYRDHKRWIKELDEIIVRIKNKNEVTE